MVMMLVISDDGIDDNVDDDDDNDDIDVMAIAMRTI